MDVSSDCSAEPGMGSCKASAAVGSTEFIFLVVGGSSDGVGQLERKARQLDVYQIYV